MKILIMNPIIEKSVYSWVKEIRNLECIKIPDETVKEICDASSKDLWNAIMTLQLYKG